MIAFMAERSPRSAGFLDGTDRQKVAAHTTAGSAPTRMELAALGVVLAGERLTASDPRVSVGGNEEGSCRTGGSAPLVAVSRAPAELCRFDWLHMQRRFGCSGAEALLGSSRAWSTAIATSPLR